MKNKNNNYYYKESYKLAIEGREHHYSNFNYWMNFYAIVIGALFVGYYTIKDDLLLKTVISFLGFASTFAWLQSFRGYYHWIKHWINVVILHEQQFLKSLDLKDNNEIDKLRVYSLYFESNDENSYCPCKSRNISTQKMTLRLIFIILVGWFFLLLGTIFIYCLTTIFTNVSSCNCLLTCLRLIFYLIAVCVFVAIIVVFTYKAESDVSAHTKFYKENDDYVFLSRQQQKEK